MQKLIKYGVLAPSSLASLKPIIVYPSGAGFPKLPWKARKRMSNNYTIQRHVKAKITALLSNIPNCTVDAGILSAMKMMHCPAMQQQQG